VVNRGAALYDDLVIFGTLDARLVALNRDTGKVVWRAKIDDFKAGYSYTAAPLIVNGLVITGVSGGEFGVVGRVEARDATHGAQENVLGQVFRGLVIGYVATHEEVDAPKVGLLDLLPRSLVHRLQQREVFVLELGHQCIPAFTSTVAAAAVTAATKSA